MNKYIPPLLARRQQTSKLKTRKRNLCIMFMSPVSTVLQVELAVNFVCTRTNKLVNQDFCFNCMFAVSLCFCYWSCSNSKDWLLNHVGPTKKPQYTYLDLIFIITFEKDLVNYYDVSACIRINIMFAFLFKSCYRNRGIECFQKMSSSWTPFPLKPRFPPNSGLLRSFHMTYIRDKIL